MIVIIVSFYVICAPRTWALLIFSCGVFFKHVGCEVYDYAREYSISVRSAGWGFQRHTHCTREGGRVNYSRSTCYPFVAHC